MNNVPVNRIFCAFPIFCPSESLFQRNLNSVRSFIEYIRLNTHYLDGSKGIILDCYWGGWSLEDKWFEAIKKLIKDELPEIQDGLGNPINFVKVFRFDKNYGKAKTVNELAMSYDDARPNTQFLFTMDSDMKFMNSQIAFFERLLLAGNCIEQITEKQTGTKKPMGMIALNQAEACYHWFEPKDGYTGLDNEVSYEVNGENNLKMQETICWASDNCGIAGGGLFINYRLYRHIGGYQKVNTSYGSDDGLLLRAVGQNGASAIVIKSLSLVHPHPEDSKEYLDFKTECMKNPFHTYNEAEYNKNVDASEKVFK